ncbi:recombination protein F [compost metagenome]
MNLIQRGKRFGKKIILNEDQVIQRLPLARLPEQTDKVTVADPLQDWVRALAPHDLLFCLESNSPTMMENYLDCKPISTQTRRSYEYTEVSSVVRPRAQIDAVQMGDKFRPHVLADAPRLSFAQVNLLEGPNGMGKTSILESIELAFTGSIQRNLIAGHDISEDWDGIVEFVGTKETLNGLPDLEEQKRRETAYYHHKVAPRSRSSQLNRAFHQYNYFSSEKIHQFCFNASQKMDYRGAFARVIFGEQLERHEQCLKSYKTEFEKAERRLLKNVDQLKAQVVSTFLQDNRHASELLQGRIHKAAEIMVGWLKHVQSSYPQPDTPYETNQIELWYQQIQPYLQELDLISRGISNFQVENIDSMTQLRAVYERNNEEDRNLAERLLLLQREMEMIPSTDILEERLRLLWSEFEDAHSLQDSLKLLKTELDSYNNLYDQAGSRAMRLQINTNWHELNEMLRPLRDAWILYESLTAIPLGDISDTEFEMQMNNEFEALKKTKEKKEELEKQIHQKEQVTSKLHQIQAELKSTALLYLDNHPEETSCPLCGHDHDSTQLLLQAITVNLKSEDDSLSELLQEAQKLELNLIEANQKYGRYHEEWGLRVKLQSAGLELRMHGSLQETINLPESPSAKEVQHALHLLNARLQSLTQQQKNLQERALELEERGIKLAAIERLEELKRSPVLVSYYEKVDADEDTFHHLQSYLGQILTDNSQMVEQARGRHYKFKEEETELNKKREMLASQINDVLLKRSQLNIFHNKLSGLAENYSKLNKKNIILREEQSWSEWRRGLDKLLEASNRLGEALEPRILLEQQEREQLEFQEKLNIASQKLERCSAAVNVLSEIKELAEYGDAFVRSNFEAISHMFVSLHSPNEFERLEWTREDMVAVRKGSGNRCHIYQLSTGQRTSVILAIFFIMHLVMDSAPPFLLLDEPVAHMDDLNIVGLLDFLRQLTITRGTQLFFTTANPQIAALFRRKFSFLKEQSRFFQLQRDVEGPLRISVGYFKPDEDKLISLTP